MDKIVTVAAVAAIVAILAVTLLLNPFSGPAVDSDGMGTTEADGASEVRSEPEAESEDDKSTHPGVNVDQATIEAIISPKVEGDCTLYKHVAKNKWDCFGTAGNYSKTSTNEYRPSESDTYFCKPTEYGCKLYQRVDFQLG